MTGTCPPRLPRSARGRHSSGCRGCARAKEGLELESKTRGWSFSLACRVPTTKAIPLIPLFQSDIREHLQLSELCTVVAAQASCQGHRPLPLLPEHSRRPLQVTVGAGPLAPPPRLPSPAGPRRHPPLPGLPSVRRRGCWASCLRGSGVAEGPGLLPQISRWWGALEYPLVPSVRPGRPRGCRGALPPPHPRNL